MAKAQKLLLETLNTYFNQDIICEDLRQLLTVDGKINIFLDNAPQGTVGKYIVYNIRNDNLDYVFGGNQDIIVLQINIYSEGSTIGIIHPISEEIEELLDGVDFAGINYIKYKNQFNLFPDKNQVQISMLFEVHISYSMN